MKEIKYCDVRKHEGVNWPITLVGETAVMRCPNGMKGNATWICRIADGVIEFWPKSPDVSQCYHNQVINKFKQRVKQHDDPTTVVKELREYIKSDAQSIDGEDVADSIVVLESCVDAESERLSGSQPLMPHEKLARSVEFTKSLGETTDALISDANMGAWEEMTPDQRSKQASALMSSLEHSADLVSTYLDPDVKKSQDFKFDHFQFQVTVMKLSPPPRGVGPPNSTESTPTSTPRGTGPPNSTNVTPTTTEGTTLPVVGELEAWPPIPPQSDGYDSKNPPRDRAMIQLPGLNILRHLRHPHGSSISGLSPWSPIAFKINDAGKEPPPTVRLGYYLFTDNLQELLAPNPAAVLEPQNMANVSNTTIVNSQIIGATVNGNNVSLSLPIDQPVVATFYHEIVTDVSRPRCVFWNTTLRQWDDRGCSLVESNKISTICSCTHLTSFAVLMDLTDSLGQNDEIDTINEEILTWLTLVGCIISIICLSLSIVAFTILRSIWSVRTTVHRNLCISLLIANILFAFGIDLVTPKIACRLIAGSLQYFFLAAFLWMLIEGYHLYLMLVKVFQTEEPRTRYYYLAAYGIPALVVGISMGIRWEDYGTNQFCWIRPDSPIIYGFIVPIGLVILLNIIVLFLALKIVMSNVVQQDKSALIRIRGWLKGSTVLLCVLGITWVFGFLLVVRPASIVIAYVFTICNSLQGLFIFVFHVLINDKIHTASLRLLRRHCSLCFPLYYESYLQSSSNSNQLRKGSQSATSGATVSSGVPLFDPRTSGDPEKSPTSSLGPHAGQVTPTKPLGGGSPGSAEYLNHSHNSVSDSKTAARINNGYIGPSNEQELPEIPTINGYALRWRGIETPEAGQKKRNLSNGSGQEIIPMGQNPTLWHTGFNASPSEPRSISYYTSPVYPVHDHNYVRTTQWVSPTKASTNNSFRPTLATNNHDTQHLCSPQCADARCLYDPKMIWNEQIPNEILSRNNLPVPIFNLTRPNIMSQPKSNLDMPETRKPIPNPLYPSSNVKNSPNRRLNLSNTEDNASYSSKASSQARSEPRWFKFDGSPNYANEGPKGLITPSHSESAPKGYQITPTGTRISVESPISRHDNWSPSKISSDISPISPSDSMGQENRLLVGHF